MQATEQEPLCFTTSYINASFRAQLINDIRVDSVRYIPEPVALQSAMVTGVASLSEVQSIREGQSSF